jgi:hypothetical protein
MFEILEPLNPNLPLITVGLAVITLWNAIKTRIQGNELKKQDLALKRIDREDKFRYLHPCSGQLILATFLESLYLTSDSFGARPAL